jgi:transcriptional regulator with XRE-family HTH domain
MGRFEQRLTKRLQDPEFAAGYREMDGELALLQAIDAARERLNVSKEELAQRMGQSSNAAPNIPVNGEEPATLDMVASMLGALGLTADITLRRAREDEAPLRVTARLD